MAFDNNRKYSLLVKEVLKGERRKKKLGACLSSGFSPLGFEKSLVWARNIKTGGVRRLKVRWNGLETRDKVYNGEKCMYWKVVAVLMEEENMNWMGFAMSLFGLRVYWWFLIPLSCIKERNTLFRLSSTSDKTVLRPPTHTHTKNSFFFLAPHLNTTQIWREVHICFSLNDIFALIFTGLLYLYINLYSSSFISDILFCQIHFLHIFFCVCGEQGKMVYIIFIYNHNQFCLYIYIYIYIYIYNFFNVLSYFNCLFFFLQFFFHIIYVRCSWVSML